MFPRSITEIINYKTILFIKAAFGLPFVFIMKEHGLDEPKQVGPAWSKASLRFPRTASGRVIAGGHPRRRKDWFSRKYASSVKRLNEVEAAAYGEMYMGLVASALEDIFGGKGAVRNL